MLSAGRLSVQSPPTNRYLSTFCTSRPSTVILTFKKRGRKLSTHARSWASVVPFPSASEHSTPPPVASSHVPVGTMHEVDSVLPKKVWGTNHTGRCWLTLQLSTSSGFVAAGTEATQFHQRPANRHMERPKRGRSGARCPDWDCLPIRPDPMPVSGRRGARSVDPHGEQDEVPRLPPFPHPPGPRWIPSIEDSRTRRKGGPSRSPDAKRCIGGP